MGHRATIFFPVAKDSLYRGKDDNFTYSNTPSIDDKFIINNVINYTIESSSGFFDNLIAEEPHMLVNSETEIPNDSKVVVETPYGRKEFTTKLVLGYKGTKDTIIYKIKLHPRSF